MRTRPEPRPHVQHEGEVVDAVSAAKRRAERIHCTAIYVDRSNSMPLKSEGSSMNPKDVRRETPKLSTTQSRLESG